MTDAFDALRRPDAPIAPSAAFAKQLRQRLTDELRPLLASATATSTSATSASATSASSTSTERTVTMTVTPYFIVRNAAAALDFYRDVFGATETQRLVGDDGRVGHAEITLGSSTMMLADEYPEVDAVGPQTRGGPTCTFNLDVGSGDRVDEVFALAVSLGAVAVNEPADQFHGNRSGTINDPFGHRWTITAQVEQLSTDEYAARAQGTEHGAFDLQMPEAPTPAADPDHQVKHHGRGDLYYFTLPVADVAKARQFFGAVLGWQFGDPEAGHIENISAPPGGLGGAPSDTGARLWFVVDDIHAAVALVREHGGTADEPVDYASGWSADCTDDQGTVFSLSVPVPEYTI